MKLTQKILLFGLIFGLILGMSIGGGAYLLTIQSVKRESGTGQRVRVEERMQKLDHFLYKKYLGIKELAGDLGFLMDNEEYLSHELKDALLEEGWDEFRIIGEKGLILRSTNKDEEGTRLVFQEEQEMYKLALRGEVVYSDIQHEDKTIGKKIIWAAPIKSTLEERKKIVGVIMVKSSEHIFDELLQSDQEKQEKMYIVSSEGKVLAYQHDNKRGKDLDNYQISKDNWNKIKQSEGVVEIEDLFFEKQTMVTSIAEPGYLDYRGNKWYLVTQISMEAVKSQVAEEILLILSSVGVILFFVVVGSVIFMNKVVVNPITRLTKAATDMTNGKMEARVDVTTTDELGQMGEAFNKLMGKLSKLNKELEDRVEERTKTLTKTMNLIVGRELKMREMKEKIKEMSKK